MSGWLIALTGVIYLGVAIEQAFVKGDHWMAIVYAGYAFANVGLYKLAQQGVH